MFFTNLDVKRYEERRNGMQAREKEGLWELLRPLMGERRHYLSRIDILNDVRAGLLSPADAERALDSLRQRRHRATLTGAVELSAESLERLAQRMERGCRNLESRLNNWAKDMECGCRRLETALRGR